MKTLDFQAWGKDAKGLFINAAEGLFSLVTGGKTHNKAGMGFLVYKKIKFEYVKQRVECEAPDQEALLTFWLTELLHAYQQKEILFQDFDIQELSKTALKATCYGPLLDDVAELKAQFKQVTFYKVKIEKKKNHLEATIVLDLN